MLMHINVLLYCAILPTSYLDNNGYLKKFKKVIKLVLKQIMIMKN